MLAVNDNGDDPLAQVPVMRNLVHRTLSFMKRGADWALLEITIRPTPAPTGLIGLGQSVNLIAAQPHPAAMGCSSRTAPEPPAPKQRPAHLRLV